VNSWAARSVGSVTSGQPPSSPPWRSGTLPPPPRSALSTSSAGRHLRSGVPSAPLRAARPSRRPLGPPWGAAWSRRSSV
jgi:hypothetical protein